MLRAFSLGLLCTQVAGLTVNPVGEAKLLSRDDDPGPNQLPVINLGYTKHRAARLDRGTDVPFYRFESIRFGQDTRKTRFKAPLKPENSGSGEIEDGSKNKFRCPSSVPGWLGRKVKPIPPCEPGHPDYDKCPCCGPGQSGDDGSCDKTCHSTARSIMGDGDIGDFSGLVPQSGSGGQGDVPESEDCLFLDVHVPRQIFADREREKRPVLVWIYGGAYTFGDMNGYKPGGLIDHSFARRHEIGAKEKGVVYVQMQYRMGALGFAAGDVVEADGEPNVGFLDQRLALEWIHDNIAKFGGDPDQVTIFGQSAGGGSVIHQVTAYGEKPAQPLFKRAFSMSGGWSPITNRTDADKSFADFMKYSKAKDLAELRNVTSERLILANRNLIRNAPVGGFGFGPVSWGKFTPESPAKLLKNKDKFASSVELMASSVVNEGGMFGGAVARAGYTFTQFLDQVFPHATKEDRAWIESTYGNNADLKDDKARISAVIADGTFRCHPVYLAKAIDGNLYRNLWAVDLSSGHGSDLLYAFWEGKLPWGVSPDSARLLQDYIVNFAMHGEPRDNLVALYPAPEKFSVGGKVMEFSNRLADAVMKKITPANETVCEKWQSFAWV